MKITDILKQKGETVFTVKEDSSVFDAVKIMDESKTGVVLVLGAKGNVVGLMSERDVLYKCYNSEKRIKNQIVKNLMTSVEDILIATLEDTPKELMNVMLYRKIRHLPVVEDEKIIGVVSIEDILKMLLDSFENESHQLRQHIRNPFGIHTYRKDVAQK